VLAPDVAFVRADRVPAPADQEHYPPVAPDLVVVILSASDRIEDVKEKVELYLGAGVPLIWVFYPRRRTVTVHRTGWPPRVF
jgi:Uma2 family endonuclease